MLGPMTRATLAIRNTRDFAAAFDVSRETLQRLETYQRLLRQWQEAVNLVAPSTLGDVWQRHFADSAQLLPLAPPGARTWLDLGSGAGFPGLVIAILLADTLSAVVPSPLVGEGQGGGDGRTLGVGAPPPRVTLIESNARKAVFLREVVRQTGIGSRIGVDILSTRIESAATQVSFPPDVISARALAPLDRLLTLAAPLFTPATVGLFMKGKEAGHEIETARKSWNFNVELAPSRTEPQGQIVLLRQPKLKNAQAQA